MASTQPKSQIIMALPSQAITLHTQQDSSSYTFDGAETEGMSDLKNAAKHSSASALSRAKTKAKQQSSLRPTSTSTNITTDGSLPFEERPNQTTLLCFSALTLSIFLAALDTVLIPTALPSITRSFHIPDSLYAWVASAYLLTNAASIPLWGKLSVIFGRKPVVLLANAVFLLGSILCAASDSASMLVAGRCVQGLGAGGINVLVYICVADLFDARNRSFYMGIVGAMYAIASALGPVLGGVFAQYLTWRWCFYVNVPLVSVALVILYFTVRLADPRASFLRGIVSLDWFGMLVIVTATILLLVGLQLGGTDSYTHPLVVCFLVLGGSGYLLFPLTQWWVEKRNRSPIMPLRIVRDVSNLAALGVCACDALVFNSVAYFLPLYFQLVLSASPRASGVYMLGVAIPLATVSFLGGWVIERTGRFLEVLQAGLTFMTIGIGLLISLSSARDLAKIIIFLAIIGIGFGPNFNAPLIALQMRIRKSDMAVGTSIFGFVRMVSGAIGVVVGQVVFQILMRPRLSAFMEAGLTSEFAEALTGGEATSQTAKVSLLSEQQSIIVRREIAEAVRGVWIFYAVVSGIGLCISCAIKRTKLERNIGDKEGV